MSALDPLVIVSNDTHIGPRLVEELRPYCLLKHLFESGASWNRTSDLSIISAAL